MQFEFNGTKQNVHYNKNIHTHINKCIYVTTDTFYYLYKLL